MKILEIASFSIFPTDTGCANAVYRFLKYFSNKKRKVVLVTTKIKNKYKNVLKIKIYDFLKDNKFSKFIDPSTYFHFIKIIKIEKPKKIIIDCPWYALFTFFVKKIYGIPYIIREHNIEFIRFKRMGRWWWKILKAYEYFAYYNAENILFISDVDKKIALDEFKISNNKCLDLPYGIDTEIFRPNISIKPVIRQKLNLSHEIFVLFFGKLDYQPNVEAIEIICDILLPKTYQKNNSIKYIIVGKNPPDKKEDYRINNSVLFTGVVPKMEDYINASDFVICPLISGGGMRTKIIESIACGKTVISTTMGAEGINFKSCKNKLIIADNWDMFAEEIINMSKKTKTINNQTVPKSFVNKYSWKQYIDKLKIFD